MVPQSQPRKPRNSSKINLIISVTFHGVLVFAILFFAAREGILGQKIKTLTVFTAKEKPPEKPKEPEKQPEPPKEIPKPTVAPKLTAAPPPAAAPAPAASAPPAAAPAAVEVPTFTFDGGRQVITADPVTVYKNLLESSVRSRWKRPADLEEKDKDFQADVEVSVDNAGQITNPRLTKSSGNSKWDESVQMAINSTKSVNQTPPKDFPGKITVRFDVVQDSEPIVP